MRAIYKHELRGYFTSMTGYVFIAFILLFGGIYTMALNLKGSSPNFEYVLGNMSFSLFIIVPVLTMRVVSEEKRQRTDQLLYSLPISTTEVILGKYFALLTVLAIPLAVMALYPLILKQFGTVYYLTTVGAIIGFFLLGAAFLSIGLFISSITESQMIAAGLSFVLLLINYFLKSLSGMINSAASTSLLAVAIVIVIIGMILYSMTKNVLIGIVSALILAVPAGTVYLIDSSKYENLFPKFLAKFSLFERFYTFIEGTFNIDEAVFFLSVCVLFVFLSVQSLEKRRWS